MLREIARGNYTLTDPCQRVFLWRNYLSINKSLISFCFFFFYEIPLSPHRGDAAISNARSYTQMANTPNDEIIRLCTGVTLLWRFCDVSVALEWSYTSLTFVWRLRKRNMYLHFNHSIFVHYEVIFSEGVFPSQAVIYILFLINSRFKKHLFMGLITFKFRVGPECTAPSILDLFCQVKPLFFINFSHFCKKKIEAAKQNQVLNWRIRRNVTWK